MTAVKNTVKNTVAGRVFLPYGLGIIIPFFKSHFFYKSHKNLSHRFTYL